MTDVFELKMCVICIGYAFSAAMVYDFGHTWLLWKKAHRFVQMLLDVITLSILGIAFTILIILAGGILRWYLLAAVCLGVTGYQLSIKKFLRKFYFWLFQQAAALWKIVTFPGRKAAGCIKKYYKKVKKSCEKNDNYTGNMPLDDI